MRPVLSILPVSRHRLLASTAQHSHTFRPSRFPRLRHTSALVSFTNHPYEFPLVVPFESHTFSPAGYKTDDISFFLMEHEELRVRLSFVLSFLQIKLSRRHTRTTIPMYQDFWLLPYPSYAAALHSSRLLHMLYGYTSFPSPEDALHYPVFQHRGSWPLYH